MNLAFDRFAPQDGIATSEESKLKFCAHCSSERQRMSKSVEIGQKRARKCGDRARDYPTSATSYNPLAHLEWG